MHKRNLFLILVLFLAILSVSFVSASENVTDEVKDDIVSSVSDEIVIDENIGKDLNENPSSTDLISEPQITNETENIDKAQVLKAGNDEIQISSVEDNQILQAGNPHVDNYTFCNGGTAQQVIETICQLSTAYGNHGGAVLYLNGNTFTGIGEMQSGDNGIIEIKNVKVIGGTVDDPTKMATFTCTDLWHSGGIALNFRGRSSDWGTKFYSNTGYSLTNVSFYYINSEDKFLQFAGGGTLTDCVVDHCQSVNQFITLIGSPDQYNQWGGLVADKKPLQINNCNFTNCNQTYGFNPDDGYDDYYDGNGQFVEALGAALNNCNFINTTSGHHGGALCIDDESDLGPATVTSKVYNCNFINVTSRWFAVYIHGNIKTSSGDLDSPEQIINCTFVNCVGTGEYSGGIGISHSDIIIENCNFTGCSGGQGGAIMVGGIDNNHDAFNGDNSEVNNVKILNCTFTNNVASTDKGYTYCTGYMQYSGNKDSSILYYERDGNGGYTPSGYGIESSQNAVWYFRHDPQNYTSSGNAGAIYVMGDGTHIKDCIFNENKAEKGAAIYIEGNNAKVENAKFYNHHSKNGTIFIDGNNASILNSAFIDNSATSGAGVYIAGDETAIHNSTFEYNAAVEGAAAYIEGDKSEISSSRFVRNSAADKGGAIYIKGDNASTVSNNFTRNMARNGSAIYTEGNNFRLQNDVFCENQAWSYLLIIAANPEESYYNTSDVNVAVRHVGGDNIINAIHNTASCDQIHFKNVTYENGNGDNMTTDSTRFVEPVAGAELSEGGTRLYQDSRGYLQKVYLRVNHENGEQVYETSRSDYLITDIYGEVNITLKRPAGSIHQLSQPLMVGEYNVYAEHPDDWYYKYINNTSTFRVLAVDSYLAVDNVVLDYGESVNLTVTADGAEGITAKIGSDNVAVKGYAILISGLNGGTYNLTVTTVPDSNHNPVTKTVNITVNKAKTVLVADAINTIYNVNKDLVITLKDANGNPVTGVDVTVNLNGAKTYTTDNRGQAKVPTAGLIPKTYTAKISFAGNTNYIGSSAEVKVIIKKASPKLTAKKKTFKKSKKVKKYTVTLKDNNGKAIKKAKLTIKIGKKTYKAKTNSKGKAVFKIKKLSKKGKYKAKITYKGNYLYKKATKNIKIIVK